MDWNEFSSKDRDGLFLIRYKYKDEWEWRIDHLHLRHEAPIPGLPDSTYEKYGFGYYWGYYDGDDHEAVDGYQIEDDKECLFFEIKDPLAEELNELMRKEDGYYD